MRILIKKIIYDDYNGNIRKDQKTMGTITSHIGSCALRQAYKVIEMYDNKPICLNSRGGGKAFRIFSHLYKTGYIV